MSIKVLKDSKKAKQFVCKLIEEFVASDESNIIKDFDNLHYYGKPLVGFSSAADKLYYDMKKIIGSSHLTPAELIDMMYKDNEINRLVDVSRASVISYALPLSKDIKMSNRREKEYPSILWAYGRYYGEIFNEKIRDYIVSGLKKAGFVAFSPVRTRYFKRLQYDKWGKGSNWSERHVAFISGLGTFGLCDGLITVKGKAHRLGSIITDLYIEPTPRKYNGHNDYCLYYSNGNCGICIERCPAGALTPDGHDKEKCFEYLHSPGLQELKVRWGIGKDGKIGCGLCQTKVPCESRVPH